MSFAGAATGAIIGNGATNAVQGSLNAENAVENNAFLFEERGALVEELRKSPQSKHNEIIEKYRKYGKEKAAQDFALCLGKGDKCHLDAIEKLRNINTQSEVFLRSLTVEPDIKSAALLTIQLNNEEISWHQSQLSVGANALDRAIQIAPVFVGMGTIAGSKLLTSKTKTEIKDVKNLGNHGQTQKNMSPVDGEIVGFPRTTNFERKTKGNTKVEYVQNGTIQDARQDFYSFNPKNITYKNQGTSNEMLLGTIHRNGIDITVIFRVKSRDGRPTIEFQKTTNNGNVRSYREVRYGNP